MWCCDLNISPRRDAKPNLCTGRTVNANFFGLRQCLHDFISFHIEAVFMFSLGLNCKPSLSGHRDLDQTWRGGGAKGQMGRCRHLQTHILQSIFDDCWYNGVMRRVSRLSGYIPLSYERVRKDSMDLWRSTDIYSDPGLCYQCYHPRPCLRFFAFKVWIQAEIVTSNDKEIIVTWHVPTHTHTSR